MEELKKAHEGKDLATIDAAMEKINTAWQAASEEMYTKKRHKKLKEPENAGKQTLKVKIMFKMLILRKLKGKINLVYIS